MRYNLPQQDVSTSAGSLSSMIDIIFLLIIFFVVTASFDNEQIDSKIDLPTVDSAAVKSLPEQRIMLNVRENGSVKIGFTELLPEEVSTKLGSLLKTHQAGPDTIIIISGDRNTRYKYISPVMNAAAQAGFPQVRINAEVNADK